MKNASSVARVEDELLLKGQGRFVDDIELPGMLHACFVRSAVAHAKIVSIQKDDALSLPGVHAIYQHKDLCSVIKKERIPQAIQSAMIKFDVDPFWLAKEEVCYVGEPVVVVLADSRRAAEDAAELVYIEYDSLPVVVDPRRGLQANSPQARLDCESNLVAQTRVKYGEIEHAFDHAPHQISQLFTLNKGGGHSIEPRGVVAVFDRFEKKLKVWDSTQMPHRARDLLVQSLALGEHQVRVIAPDVGGGFGPKAVIHPEEIVIPALAMLCGHPVKWIEDRLESFSATVLERLQYWDMHVAFDHEGRLLGIKGHLYHDHGACTPYGVALPYNAVTNLVGPYVLPALDIEICLCLTNMVPATPTRGAGRPQGTFVMERFLDKIACALNLDRAEVRRRNLIQASAMPYTVPILQRDGSPMCYDTGDYLESQKRALEAFDWVGFKEKQRCARDLGKYIGLGLANYVEATGRGPFESGSVRIGPSGQIVVTTGATAQGQGVKTMLSQIVAEQLGVQAHEIEVQDGDTDASALGFGAFASRQAVTAGNAVFLAAGLVAEKIKLAASEFLEVSKDDLVLEQGFVKIKGAAEINMSFAQIARKLAGVPGFALPKGLKPGLAEFVDFEPAGLTYTNGTHLAEVEVDVQTGGVVINRYLVMHDCGRIINQMMVDGQVYGGVVHGIGATLFEWMRYDEEGQPLTATYADYLLPTADVVPRIEIMHMESPTPLNPMGVKGAAESGTIGAPSAIVSAIDDALSPFKLELCDLPITPAKLQALISHAQERDHSHGG
ncbi:MAG: xanthine dehydrogenase family protein molybdopterin-binding subunit [Betaproteobacteria bacterium]